MSLALSNNLYSPRMRVVCLWYASGMYIGSIGKSAAERTPVALSKLPGNANMSPSRAASGFNATPGRAVLQTCRSMGVFDRGAGNAWHPY